MLSERFVGKTAQLVAVGGKVFRPGSFILKLGENLGGNRVLLLLRQAGNLFERLFKQLGHRLNLADASPVCNTLGGKSLTTAPLSESCRSARARVYLASESLSRTLELLGIEVPERM